MPVLEEMACGCPVACSQAASLPEVGGGAAVYFDPYNVRRMAEGIRMAMNCREKLRKLGLEQARKFNWEKTAKETWEVYEEVVAE